MKPGALSSPLEAQLLVKLFAFVQVELWKAETTVVCPWPVFPPPQTPTPGLTLLHPALCPPLVPSSATHDQERQNKAECPHC